jgi:hypothetical protein
MTMMVDPDQTGCPAHLHRGDGCPTLAASVSMKENISRMATSSKTHLQSSTARIDAGFSLPQLF